MLTFRSRSHSFMSNSSAGTISLTVFLIFSLNNGCTYFRQAFKKAEPPAAISQTDSNDALPVLNLEPDIYEAEIVETISDGDESSETKTFIARNGAKRLTIFSFGEDAAISSLEIGANEKFLISYKDQTFAKLKNGAPAFPSGDSLEDFLTNEWLSQKSFAAFEKLEAENGLARFRVRLKEAESESSSAIIYVDEKLHLPVKQEFFTDENSPPVYVMKLQNIKLETEPKHFEVPSGFREISPVEFQELIESSK